MPEEIEEKPVQKTEPTKPEDKKNDESEKPKS